MAGNHETQPGDSDSLQDSESGEVVLRKDTRQPSNASPIVMIDMVQNAIHALGENASVHERGEAVMKAIGDAYEILSEENKAQLQQYSRFHGYVR